MSDRYLTEIDGVETWVETSVTVIRSHPVGYSGSIITRIETAEGNFPKAVTRRVADTVWRQFAVDVRDHDICVINSDSSDPV